MLHEVRLASRGGTIAPGALRNFAQGACRAGLHSLYMDRRQTLSALFADTKRAASFLEACPAGLAMPASARSVVSSLYAAHKAGTSWVTESVFLEILDSIPDVGKRDVSVLDPLRDVFPFHREGLVFQATEMRDLWSAVDGVSAAVVSTSEIGPLAAEESLEVRKLGAREGFVFLRERDLVRGERINLEGIQLMSDGFLRVGLFRADHTYPLVLLDELAALCRESGVGRILFTPYHSILVRGIPAAFAPRWEEFVKRHSINLQHSQIDLGWSADRSVERERGRFVKYLRESDYGVSGFDCDFAVGKETGVGREFTIAVTSSFPVRRYSLSLREGRPSIVSFSMKTIARAIGSVRWDSRFERPSLPVQKPTRVSAPPKTIRRDLMKCAGCSTIYDADLGDSFSDTPPGTSFVELPDSYICPVCAAPKDAFRAFSMSV